MATARRATARPAITLDGEWRFVADPERLHSPGGLPEGEPIAVPGCWEAQVSRPYGIIRAWYHRSVGIPDEWRGRRAVFCFGAVMYHCTAFLNGSLIGEHEGGYTAFEIDATDAVRWGADNDLAVLVVNPLNALDEFPAFNVEEMLRAQELEPDVPLSEAPHGKQTWYSSQSGIWQSVRIEARAPVALRPLRIRPDLAGGTATVDWALAGSPRDGLRPHTLEITINDPRGDEVAVERIDLGDGRSRGALLMKIPDPVAWDIGEPHLYVAEARLLDGRADAADGTTARFGMRDIATSGGRILLNGRPVYLLGVLDQDLYPDTISTPPSRAYLDDQVRLAQEMGINLLRCHIKVPDPAYLDTADEAGILVWAELPNWTRFSTAAARRGRQTLQRMVQTLGNHPSIVIWTVINEDWGTQLRYEARDRRWLRDTSRWLKRIDPTRLVVDNSACETPQTPNFHLRSDLADFHVYFVAPDNAIRWKNMVADFARRPAWLWSPHGDVETTGEEPLVLSEFGSWGLPRLGQLVVHTGREPWWFRTGRRYYLPAGVARRFEAYGLDRIWRDVDELADATQWHQFECLQYEIGQLRRHDSIQGYVITELSDANWEANGLLDAYRGTKVYHDRLRAINAPDVVVADLDRRDAWAGERLAAEVTLSSYGPPTDRGRVTWELELAAGERAAGKVAVTDWPRAGARSVGRIEVAVPDVTTVSDATLTLRAFDAEGIGRTDDAIRLAVVPRSARRTAAPIQVAVHDALDIWGVGERLSGLGHHVVRDDHAQLVVATELSSEMLRQVEDGARGLVLVRTRSAIPEGHDLARRVSVHLRRLPHAGWPGQRSPWEGDWVTSWSWIRHDELRGLPRRNPLDFAYEEVLPDHVLLGYDPTRHRDEVPAGMFVGWVHAPAALVWTFRQGRGAITLTTFRVAPECGPVATLLLERLVQHAAAADRRHGARLPSEVNR